jgi:hypothetical protein
MIKYKKKTGKWNQRAHLSDKIIKVPHPLCWAQSLYSTRSWKINGRCEKYKNNKINSICC